MKKINKILSILAVTAIAITSMSFAQTIEFYNFYGAEFEATVDKINEMFMTEYPDITVIAETADTGTFTQVLNTRLAANDAPDVFLVFPGTKFHPQADAGYLMTFDDAPWVERVMAGAKSVSTYNGHQYALPTDTNVISVLYNKDMFADLGLEIPTTWDEFKAVGEALKAEDIAPLSVGVQSGWVAQLIPYAMAPTAIYKHNIDFDAQMYGLENSFVDSAWAKMMEDYAWLKDNDFMQEFPLSTDWNASTDIMAANEAAMLVQGNWALGVLQEKAPDTNWGLFPFPYSDDGVNWVATGVGGAISGSATTEHPEAVAKYIEFWSRPEIMDIYLTEKKALPVLTGLNPDIAPELVEFLPYLEAAGTYNFLDQNWPAGVQGVMISSVQGVLAGNLTIEQMLQDMDAAWAEGMLTAE